MEKQTTQEYEKAIAYIIDRIKEGSLQLGSKLPPERRIAEELGIGRNSIREAISILHGMGLIERVQGSGNYVSKHVGESIRQSLTVMLALGTITKEEIFEFRRVMEKAVCSNLIAKGLSYESESILETKFCTVRGDDADKAGRDEIVRWQRSDRCGQGVSRYPDSGNRKSSVGSLDGGCDRRIPGLD